MTSRVERASKLKSKSVRLTKRAPKKYLKGTKGGRPKGTKKKYPFSQTKLGFMMKYETPLTYRLMMTASNKTNNYFFAPDIQTILTYAKASNDPSFSKPKFFRYLNEYEETGLYCGRPKIMDRARDEYYTKIMNNKLDAIKKNRAS